MRKSARTATSSSGGARARTPPHITTPLRWAHERGMSAMLIPHIAYWGTKFSWRGEINFVTPEEWDRFFSDYETWIVQMAALAEEEKAEIFCVGLEFSYAQKYEERWRKIIAAVRAVYRGKVTYGANWNEYAEVKFWDALDYMGVLAYFPLTKNENPSAAGNSGGLGEALRRAGEIFEAKRQTISLCRDRLQHSSRAAAEPWGFKTGGEHAAEIQQRCIDAALRLPAKHSFHRRHVLVEMVPRDPSPPRGKLQIADRADQGADRKALEESGSWSEKGA